MQVAQLKSGKGDTTDSVAATAACVQDLQKEAAATPSQAAADPAAAKQQSSATKGKISYFKKSLKRQIENAHNPSESNLFNLPPCNEMERDLKKIIAFYQMIN